MICAEGLSRKFEKTIKQGRKTKKAEFLAVDHISLEADKGEIVGILGPNGAGKTTLLRMLGMLMTPTEGKVSIYDQDGEEIPGILERKAAIGYLSGNTRLYQRFSCREYLKILGDIYGMTSKQRDERIEEVFSILSMDEFGDNRMEKLSTGQTQRASIARCLFHDPAIFILDEPTLGLDVLSSDAIIHFMKEQKQVGKTVLYSTHYLEEAQFLCDKLYIICQGRIIAQGTPQEIIASSGGNNLREAFQYMMKEAKWVE